LLVPTLIPITHITGKIDGQVGEMTDANFFHIATVSFFSSNSFILKQHFVR